MFLRLLGLSAFHLVLLRTEYSIRISLRYYSLWSLINALHRYMLIGLLQQLGLDYGEVAQVPNCLICFSPLLVRMRNIWLTGLLHIPVVN